MEQTTKAVPFKTKSGLYQVTRDEIRAAMKEFNLRFRSSEADSGTLYAVEDEEEALSPQADT